MGESIVTFHQARDWLQINLAPTASNNQCIQFGNMLNLKLTGNSVKLKFRSLQQPTAIWILESHTGIPNTEGKLAPILETFYNYFGLLWAKCCFMMKAMLLLDKVRKTWGCNNASATLYSFSLHDDCEEDDGDDSDNDVNDDDTGDRRKTGCTTLVQ